MKKRFYILLLISFLLSLADVQAQQKATPKAGEGISTFLLRHNRAPKKYYDDFVELNKAKQGKGKTDTHPQQNVPPARLRGRVMRKQRRISKTPQAFSRMPADTAVIYAKTAAERLKMPENHVF